jgi:hypothetical protein
MEIKHAFLSLLSSGCLLLPAALVGCGGGGGGGASGLAPDSPTGAVLSGTVAKGLLQKATVTAYCGLESVGTSLGSATTAADGTYSLTLSKECTQPVEVVASANPNTTMLDELEGTIAAPSDFSMRAFASVADASTATQHVTPFTDMAAAIVENSVSSANVLSSDLVGNANTAVVTTVLGGNTALLTAEPLPPSEYSSSSTSSDQQQLIVLLTGISQASQTATGETSGAKVKTVLTQLKTQMKQTVPKVTSAGYTVSANANSSLGSEGTTPLKTINAGLDALAGSKKLANLGGARDSIVNNVAEVQTKVIRPAARKVDSASAGVGCSITGSGTQELSYDKIAQGATPTAVTESLNYTYTWTCGTARTLSGNAVPNHATTGGQFATNVSAQTISKSFPLSPVASDAVTLVQIPGYLLNSIKLEPGTAGKCDATATSVKKGCDYAGTASYDNPSTMEVLQDPSVIASSWWDFGADASNAHVQPNGEYHYHGMPNLLIPKLNTNSDSSMTLVGWAMDGFPIYADKGYTTAGDATSALKSMKGSYRLKTTGARTLPSPTYFPLGMFVVDWEYVAGLGDLDECNGRTGVTPEFPKGTYHYYITSTYPFIQRCTKGSK